MAGLKIYIAGHAGLVGSALVRRFSSLPDVRLVTVARSETDLTNTTAVERFFFHERPDIVIIAAGKVGGILANSAFPAEFIYENLMIEANLIHCAWKAGVKRLLNFGSSCMYPRQCSQPMSPDQLMTGKMEPTSEPYAMAKWAGLTLCEAYNRQYGTRFITAIPCTVYGPGDSFDLGSAHVISALVRRFHEAKIQEKDQIMLWGSGNAKREFIYADDLAQACEFLLLQDEISSLINVGSGISHSIHEIADEIAQLVGFRGEIRWDSSKPDGAPEKLLDSCVIHRMGWLPMIDLQTGLERTYRWFVGHHEEGMKERVCVSS